ncbi:MAG: sulfotransferase [Fimbriimonas sp.]|nr:sulfotransferase [Fimbriimonas sp.]
MSLRIADRLRLGAKEFGRNNVAAALVHFEAVLEIESNHSEALLYRGIIRVRMRQDALAISDLEQVLQGVPDQFDAVTFMALAHKRLGHLALAKSFAERAITLQPRDPTGYNTLGLCCMAMHLPDQAVRAFGLAGSFGLAPGPMYHNLGEAYEMMGRIEDARDAFRMAVEADPGKADNHLSLFRQLQLMAQWDEAVTYMESAHRRFPRLQSITEALATAYGRVGRHIEAESLFKSVCDPGSAPSQNFAAWLQSQGRFDESVELLGQSIEQQPKQGYGYYGLTEARVFSWRDGDLLDKMLAVEEEPGLDPGSRMYLHYAIGRAFDHRGDYEQAMRHWDLANALAFQLFAGNRPFDDRLASSRLEAVTGMFSAEKLQEQSGKGSSSQKPIFVVGMIRSGTTLLDRIIAGGGEARSAGEPQFWIRDADKSYRKWLTSGIDSTDFPELIAGYLRLLDLVSADSCRVIDKMPLNYQHLGAIHMLFPECPIVHIRRNPVDTCLSIHQTCLSAGADYAFQRQSIVAFYMQYLRYMEHWRSVLPPDRLLEIDYEALVTHPEDTIQQVVEFCGLHWSDLYLHPEQSETAIQTPSRWQARRPIYMSSVDRWKRYEPWLGAFGDLKAVTHPPILA